MNAIAEPYRRQSSANRKEYVNQILDLTKHHVLNCDLYRRICNNLYPRLNVARELDEIPPLPTTLFKRALFKSVADDQVFRVFRSSGTSGLQSSVVLDMETARLQEQALSAIMKFWLGSTRRPMLLVDSPSVLSGNSARSAAIRGMFKFGRNHHWLLDEQGNVDRTSLDAWMARVGSKGFFIFGFTFVVWKSLMSEDLNGVEFSDSILFHGGGWKRLEDSAVSRNDFRSELQCKLGIGQVKDYYGLVEQLGNIWVESSPGLFSPSSSSFALIRDPDTLEVVPDGSPGLIQLFTSIPKSYPGHSLLTEDIGRIIVNEHRPDLFGNWGLEVLGRLPKTQARGCSDAVF